MKKTLLLLLCWAAAFALLVMLGFGTIFMIKLVLSFAGACLGAAFVYVFFIAPVRSRQ